MAKIRDIIAREVLDSRGRPTVEVEVHAGEAMGRAIVPSGASTGAAEALELRDGGDRYAGWGVANAVANVRQIIRPELLGHDADDQTGIDQKLIALDGDSQKANLGANAALGVSLAAVHVSAALERQPLWRRIHDVFRGRYPQHAVEPAMPTPMVNMISGGLHAGANLDIQDVLMAPGPKAAYPDQLEAIVRAYWRLGELLKERGFEGRLVGDEGGYGPKLAGNRDAVATVVEACEQVGLRPGETAFICLDVAASHFYQDGSYRLANEDAALSRSEMIDRLAEWVDAFPIISIEDGLAEDDWEGWMELTERLGSRVRLVGDDLFTTNCERIQHGLECGAGNSVLIKLNQIGTLSETLDAIALCREVGFAFVVSARSGESEDSTIADLAVGVAAPEIKIGSVARSERLAKYNQLLRIHEQLERS